MNKEEMNKEKSLYPYIIGAYGNRTCGKAYIQKLAEENKQLRDNWNKLKEYASKTKIKEFEKSFGKRYGKTFTQAEIICNMIIDKMRELEKGDINE